MKNPDKDYIYWPNREEIITKQIEKIKSKYVTQVFKSLGLIHPT